MYTVSCLAARPLENDVEKRHGGSIILSWTREKSFMAICC